MPAQAECLTPGNSNDQLLYFTSSSLDRNDRLLWYISNRSGDVNIHLRDLSSGADTQLTDNTGGRMWQYQGFNGSIRKGLAVWAVALDSERRLLYFIQDNQLRCVDSDGRQRQLATLPDHQTCAFIHVSDCGSYVCVPCTDDRALVQPVAQGCAPGGNKAIDQRCQDEGLNSYLYIYDSSSGKLVNNIAVPRCWITHVQFRPGRPEQVLYNHEWPSQVGVRRMWLWDGCRHRCVRPAADGRSPDDWICHEVWSPDGENIIYHGGFHNGSKLIGRWSEDGNRHQEIALPDDFERYGHFQIGYQRDNLLVCDGYYQQDDDEPGPARWLSLQEVDWDRGTITWIPLCRHRSSWHSQDDHPHPIFDHAGNYIYFTGGDEHGIRSVYRVPIHHK